MLTNCLNYCRRNAEKMILPLFSLMFVGGFRYRVSKFLLLRVSNPAFRVGEVKQTFPVHFFGKEVLLTVSISCTPLGFMPLIWVNKVMERSYLD